MMDVKCKQALDRQSGVDLLEKVNNFAEIYWETKGVSTEMKTEHYGPNCRSFCQFILTNLYKNLFKIFRVQGNSMLPSFRPNDLVLCLKLKKYRMGLCCHSKK